MLNVAVERVQMVVVVKVEVVVVDVSESVRVVNQNRASALAGDVFDACLDSISPKDGSGRLKKFPCRKKYRPGES